MNEERRGDRKGRWEAWKQGEEKREEEEKVGGEQKRRQEMRGE